MSLHKVIAPGVIGEDSKVRLSRREEFDRQIKESFKPGQKVLTTTEDNVKVDTQFTVSWR